MKLFQVQDSDHPRWVVANSYGDAVLCWKEHVAKENDMAPEDVEEPAGVHFVCDDPELISSAGAVTGNEADRNKDCGPPKANL